MPIRPRPIRCAGLLLALLAGGCAVGPNFVRPPAPVVGRYTVDPIPSHTGSAPARGGSDQTLVGGMDVAGRWWTLFHSPAIDALVDRALAHNADAEAARAALRVARETYLAQRGALFPTVDASYNVARQKASNVLAPPLSSNDDLFTLHTAQLTVSYVPDVFGGIRRQNETVAAQAEAQRFESEATYLTLTTNVVSGAVQEAFLRDQIAALKRVIEVERNVLGVLRKQKALGQITGLDVATQESVLAQALEALPPIEKQREQQRDQLAALTGRLPGDGPMEEVDLATLTLPAALPLSLPSRIVEQRPDVRAAEANLHAASAQVGVAIANRLPNFALSATAGGASTSLSNLFSNGAAFYTLGATIAQPIFEGGTLLHRQRAARAALDQAGAQYRSTVIDAFQNVADALQAIQADTRAFQAAAEGERSASHSLTIIRAQVSLGQVNSVALLTEEQIYQQAVVARLQAEGARYADSVALFQALGGGWWNRKDL